MSQYIQIIPKICTVTISILIAPQEGVEFREKDRVEVEQEETSAAQKSKCKVAKGFKLPRFVCGK